MGTLKIETRALGPPQCGTFITRPTWCPSPICQNEADKRRCGTAVGAVSRLLVTMYTAKRPRSKSKADLSKDLNRACSASKTAQRTSHEEPSAKRFVPTPAAVMTTTSLLFVLTMLSVMGYWKQLPNVPETAKAFVDVQSRSPKASLRRRRRCQGKFRCTSRVLSMRPAEQQKPPGFLKRSEQISEVKKSLSYV
eukprot:scaffold40167_cov91-Phaeocystis_antarctica.AAC.4